MIKHTKALEEVYGSVAATTPLSILCDECKAAPGVSCHWHMLHGVLHDAEVPEAYHAQRMIDAGRLTWEARRDAMRAYVATLGVSSERSDG